MRKLLILLVVLSLLLCSCRKIEENAEESTKSETTAISTTAEETTEKQSEETESEEPEQKPILPCLIGFYDEITEPGTYTRLTEWNDPWVLGKDIAVFDIIPSNEETLTGSVYKDLWISESDKISADSLVKPYFILEYTLKDGTEKSVEIKGYSDAEAIIAEGYLEVYLYDDVHQDGGWYYHLTADTTNDDTVISSFKLTAGKEIDSVDSITLYAYIDGSSAAVIEIRNGNN